MKIQINIQKKHLIFLTFLFIGLAGLVIVFAQTTPNPGHDISQIFGAAYSCSSQPSHSFCAEAVSIGWGLEHVAIAAGLASRSLNSTNAEQLGNIPANSYCQSNGVNCPPGTIIGGGTNGYSGGSICAPPCSVWGGATCTSQCGNVVCPSGSTPRKTGQEFSTQSQVPLDVYICVKN